MSNASYRSRTAHSLSIVIPVFRGEQTLGSVVDELALFKNSLETSSLGISLHEVILVHDCGADRSDEVMRSLAQKFDFVKNVWLARNSGQHAATLAGMASSVGDWIVTMDEDGQHDPDSLPGMLKCALSTKSDLVYGRAINRLPHSHLRNLASRLTKSFLLPLLIGGEAHYFSSFRLMLGEIGRSLAAFASNDVYLDVALSWVARSTTTHDVILRKEKREFSGYSLRSLTNHFVRLVLSAGTRPLRVASVIGGSSFVAGIVVAVMVAVGKVWYGFNVVGWASMVSLLLTIGGLILFVLGIIAEYVGLLVRTAIGRPLYVIINDRAIGPLYRD